VKASLHVNTYRNVGASSQLKFREDRDRVPPVSPTRAVRAICPAGLPPSPPPAAAADPPPPPRARARGAPCVFACLRHRVWPGRLRWIRPNLPGPSRPRAHAHTHREESRGRGGGWGSAGPRGDEGEADAEETFIPVELAGTTTGQIQIC